MKLILRTLAFLVDYLIFVMPASIIIIMLDMYEWTNIHAALFIFSSTYALLICKDIVGGQSLGKRLFQLKVINERSNHPPKAWQYIVRSLFIPFWIIELIMLGINSNKRIGDYAANTKVVRYPNGKKSISEITTDHCLTVIFVAIILYLLFLLLFLTTKAFHFYYV